jgi:hypothetical protein
MGHGDPAAAAAVALPESTRVNQRAGIPIGEPAHAAEPREFDDGPTTAVRMRREHSARVRRRRLLVADVAVGAALALFGIILAPGLAIVALGAVIVLCGCAAWAAGEHLRRRRRRRRGGRRARRRPGPKLDPTDPGGRR